MVGETTWGGGVGGVWRDRLFRSGGPAMRVKLFTFRYSSTLGGFDDTPLLDFIRDQEVLSFSEHFFAVNEVAHVTCVVTCQDAIVPRNALAPAPTHDRHEGRDPTAELSERDRT